jgi:hypothetical protein
MEMKFSTRGHFCLIVFMIFKKLLVQNTSFTSEWLIKKVSSVGLSIVFSGTRITPNLEQAT